MEGGAYTPHWYHSGVILPIMAGLQTKAHIEKIFETSTILQLAVITYLFY